MEAEAVPRAGSAVKKSISNIQQGTPNIQVKNYISLISGCSVLGFGQSFTSTLAIPCWILDIHNESPHY